MVQFTLTSYGHTRGHWSLACGLAANKWIKHSLVAALIDNFWHLLLFLLCLMGSCPSTSFFFELWINSAALQIFCIRKREYAERENVQWCPTLVTLSDAEHSKVSHKEGGSLSLLTAFATSVTSSSESPGKSAPYQDWGGGITASAGINRNYEPWLIINLIVSLVDKAPSINNLQCSHLML